MSNNLFPTLDSPHNWREDSSHENGNYFNECVECETMFLGHKRRAVCWVCAKANEEEWKALTDEEKTQKIAEVAQQMRKIFPAKNQ